MNGAKPADLDGESGKRLYAFVYIQLHTSRILPERLTRPQLVKKFSAFYGTRMFITAFTTLRHLPLSRVKSIQSKPPQPTSLVFIFILSLHLRLGLPSDIFPPVLRPKSRMHLSCLPYVLHAPPISFFLIFHPNKIW